MIYIRGLFGLLYFTINIYSTKINATELIFNILLKFVQSYQSFLP